ncbi:hypothetical protein [Tautonia rosea]|uniref:hypothetical protein n=1 Tax=Tautonia rosea TaxID=2728037 RepID=UPI0014747023|nr:hypothetical protein [Tautonia rosea]
MRQIVVVAVIGTAISFGAARLSLAQSVDVNGVPMAAPIYDAPGYYGMAWGVASYGVPRTHSNFATPFGGVGYGYGYDPYVLLPGSFGASLWRPGSVNPGDYSAPGRYSTFPIPRGGVTPPWGVPVGFYAPALGPPIIVQP